MCKLWCRVDCSKDTAERCELVESKLYRCDNFFCPNRGGRCSAVAAAGWLLGKSIGDICSGGSGAVVVVFSVNITCRSYPGHLPAQTNTTATPTASQDRVTTSPPATTTAATAPGINTSTVPGIVQLCIKAAFSHLFILSIFITRDELEPGQKTPFCPPLQLGLYFPLLPRGPRLRAPSGVAVVAAVGCCCERRAAVATAGAPPKFIHIPSRAAPSSTPAASLGDDLLIHLVDTDIFQVKFAIHLLEFL